MKKRLIPRIDLKGPNLIKTVFYEGLRVIGNPLPFIEKYYEDGADEIIVNDLVASLYKRKFDYNILKTLKQKINLPITAGGGIKTISDIEQFLSSGADKVFINSHAIKDPNFLSLACNTFGSSTISISIDTSFINNNYFCITEGGKNISKLDVESWIIETQKRGVGEIILNSLDLDGTGKGYDIKLYQKVSNIINVPVVVSGGFGNIKHIKECLSILNVSGFSIGSSIHYKFLENNIKKIKSQKFSEGNTEFIKNFYNYFKGTTHELKFISKQLEKI
mgnify:CR=1 FL=1